MRLRLQAAYHFCTSATTAPVKNPVSSTTVSDPIPI